MIFRIVEAPMPRTPTLIVAIALVFGFLSSAAPASAASVQKVLYSFCSAFDCNDGAGPAPSFVFDAAGNLYGTTNAGGAHSRGTVFELMPGSDGNWTETVLYSFCSKSNCEDGQQPSAGLVLDASGNLYGTALGGIHRWGEVFELSPTRNGKWTEKVIYSFCSGHKCSDGKSPYGGLIFDAAGNLYGTTAEGGVHSEGTVFALTPGSNGTWEETVLHGFSGKDGRHPFASLIFDATGNLYGTARLGGAHNAGTVFQLVPGENGTWSENVLHSFSNNGKDGFDPYFSSLVLDAAGNVYGATRSGGTHDRGIAFRLQPSGTGKWLEKVLHNFCSRPHCTDGSYPSNGGLVFDANGNLYGATVAGGTGNGCGGEGCGIVFQLVPGANDKWTEAMLYSFDGSDGGEPNASVIFDSAGNLFGTTLGGGTGNDGGTIFEITP
jgi:uncharacterized repeat protein (TIGR03803 family)